MSGVDVDEFGLAILARFELRVIAQEARLRDLAARLPRRGAAGDREDQQRRSDEARPRVVHPIRSDSHVGFLSLAREQATLFEGLFR
jgi:hypothetical protein